MEIRLQFLDGSSDKFWRVEVTGSDVVTSWGRTGTDGRAKTETFPSDEKAMEAADRAADAKRRKGYVDDRGGETITVPPQKYPQRGSPKPAVTRSDRNALAAFFRSINHDDFIALPPDSSRFTQQDGHTDAGEEADHRGLGAAEFHTVFWHQQSAERSWDPFGNMVQPLLLHWQGDHARVAAALSGIPAPYIVTDNGPREAFVVRHPEMDSRQRERPDPTDGPAVKGRVKWLRDQAKEEWTKDDWQWMNDILRFGEPSTQALVADILIQNPSHLDEQAFEALMLNWVAVYRAGGEDVGGPDSFLTFLHARQDPRFDEAMSACIKQRGWIFRWAAGRVLGDRGDEKAIPTLYKLATAKHRYPSSAANPPAIAGWLLRRSVDEGRNVAELAMEALEDPHFDSGARRELIDEAAYDLDRVKRQGRAISGLLGILHMSGLTVDVQKEVLARIEKQRWDGVEPNESSELRNRYQAIRDEVHARDAKDAGPA